MVLEKFLFSRKAPASWDCLWHSVSQCEEFLVDVILVDVILVYVILVVSI